MTGASADLARAVAQKLSDLDPGLPALVETRLQAGADAAPNRYDPTLALAIALAGLVVNVAGLAWKIYWDLRSAAKAADAQPAPEVLTRRLRLEIELPPQVTDAQRDRIIAVVVDEIRRADQTS